MEITALVFVVLLLLILLLKERNDGKHLPDGTVGLPIDGLQLAHDLRSPLMVLKSLIGDGESFDTEKRELVKKLLARMEDLTSMKLSKNAEHFKKDSVTQLKLEEMVSDVIEEKKVEFSKKLIKWEVNVENGIKVMAAEYPLKRILSNILNNAVEAMEGKGKISLRTRQCEQGNIILEIEDNGPGISSENLKKVLDRGFTTKARGHGLGLHHARETLKKWKGSLEVESVEGKGTVISILLISCGPEMVLLENDELIRYGWNILARRRGVSIKTFANSKELLSQIKSFGEQTTFYLDEELGEKLRGRDVAKRLYRKGFREIYITSGHEAEYFGKNKFIKGVLPKDFPAPAQ